MDQDDARQVAERFLRTNPPAEPDAVLVDVQEHQQCFVGYWSTARAVASRSPADAPAPGIGPVAVPKDGSAPRYLSSQRLDVALHLAGLGPEPQEQAPSW